METQRRLNIVGVGLDLIDDRGIDLANLDAPIIRVHKETDELLAIQRQFRAEGIDARIHVIIGIVPEIHQDLLHLGPACRDGNALSQHETGGDLNDGEGQGIGVISLVTGVMQFQVSRGNYVLLVPVVA